MYKKITLAILLLSILNISFGMVKHTHVCSKMNEQKQGFVKQECEMDFEEPSCHQPKKETCCKESMKEPCCTDSTEFDTQDQVQQEFDLSLLFDVPSTYIDFKQLLVHEISTPNVDIYPRPPNLRYTLLYQQVLC